MGTITAVIKKRTMTNAGRANVVDLTLSSSYATNGDTLPTNAQFGLDNSLDLLDLSGSAAGYVFEVDHTNRKLKAYRNKNPGAPGGTDIAFPEVANTTNLSAVTVRAIVHGDLPNV